ncbi:MAG: plastocyanin/azurin family copper-binding protein [Rudaea sp.]
MSTRWRALPMAWTLAACSLGAMAHGGAPSPGSGAAAGPMEQTRFGIAGDPDRAARMIAVKMSDAMRFSPSIIHVRTGETVRLRVTNEGATRHEMVLGTLEDLRQHAAMMRKFPEMEHAEPFIAHVAPGETGEIVWTFNRPGQFHFACLVAGHFEAGMVGRVVVDGGR